MRSGINRILAKVLVVNMFFGFMIFENVRFFPAADNNGL